MNPLPTIEAMSLTSAGDAREGIAEAKNAAAETMRVVSFEFTFQANLMGLWW